MTQYVSKSLFKRLVDNIQRKIDKVANSSQKVTKEDIGLGNVDNTSDEDKPVSKAAKQYIDAARQYVDGFAFGNTNDMVSTLIPQVRKSTADKETTNFYDFLIASPESSSFTLTIDETALSDPDVEGMDDYFNSMVYPKYALICNSHDDALSVTITNSFICSSSFANYFNNNILTIPSKSSVYIEFKFSKKLPYLMITNIQTYTVGDIEIQS